MILAPENEKLTGLPRIVCDVPYAYFARVSQLFNPLASQAPGVHPRGCRFATDAVLGESVSIGAGCVVGEGVTIGDDSCLYPRVVVYRGCSLGRRVIVHSGAVIGADGFGIAQEDGRWVKIPQIGARAHRRRRRDRRQHHHRPRRPRRHRDRGGREARQPDADRRTTCRIGAHTAIAGCAGVAGSADIGRHCTIGGAAVILGHLRIVDHVHVSAGTLISRSILKPGTYTGIYPFDEHALVRNAHAQRLRSSWRGRSKSPRKRRANG